MARDGATLVFAEVKTRRAVPRAAAPSPWAAGPLERLGPRQQARLRRFAAAYLRERPASARAPRRCGWTRSA